MKVFLIGGNGLLGSAAAEQLISKGHEVSAIALAPNPEGAKLPAGMKLEFKNYLNLSDSELRECFAGCGGFVFASGVDERVEGPPPAYDFFAKYNLAPLERLLRIAKECGVKHASICGSYFSYFDREWPKEELARWHPYIRMRRDQEQMALAFACDSFSVGILELPYIFGAQAGREPVWTILINTIRSMKGATMYPDGGTAIVTRRQVGQALAGALEKTQGGKCWPIGWWNMSWKEFLAIVHKHMGTPRRKIITVPKWLFKIGIKAMEKKLRDPTKEGGLDMKYFAPIQCGKLFIDKSLSCVPLGVTDDDIDAAIGESIRLSMDVLDGKIKNVVAMKGE